VVLKHELQQKVTGLYADNNNTNFGGIKKEM
jgi:hypothetical protein